MGNHDWDTTGAAPYLNYFTLPGNERYYEFTWGPIHFFVLDSDPREPNGISSTSPQGQWLQGRMTASKARMQVVYFHHPPYSSGSVHGSTPEMQWPFKDWGADLVLTGHDHTYERLLVNGLTYLVVGTGGRSLYALGTPVAGSQVRYNADYGALLVDVQGDTVSFKFINRANATIDAFTLPLAPLPAPPLDPSVIKVALPLPAPTGTVVRVSTVGELQSAVSNLQSNTTVLISTGLYRLSQTLQITGGVRNIAIRGATNNRDDVILMGQGMTNPDYGNVPHGIWIGNAQDVLIANLTISSVWYHPIQLDPNVGAQSPHIYNVRLVDAGEQFVKSSATSARTGNGVNNGTVEYCLIEYTTTARDTYTNGVDVLEGSNWIIRNNILRNIRAPAGLAGPAILMWNRSKDTITEGNLLLNCQYGIAYGLDPVRTDDHLRGIIRNNMVYRSSAQSGDVGITINNSAQTKALNNTVVLSGTYPNAMEYRFAATTGVDIRYNLTDGAVRSRDGAGGTVSNNVTNASTGWFVNPGMGDLHLTSLATGAVDQAIAHPDVLNDYDGQSRSPGLPDIGADEFLPAAVKGDANGDGGFDLADVNQVIKWLAGFEPTPGTGDPRFRGADVNCDGEVDLADVNWMIKVLVGIASTFSC